MKTELDEALTPTHVTVKRSLLFFENPDCTGRRHLLKASSVPQELPAWVRDVAAYKQGIALGLIKEMRYA
jgi:hypothetical protein